MARRWTMSLQLPRQWRPRMAARAPPPTPPRTLIRAAPYAPWPECARYARHRRSARHRSFPALPPPRPAGAQHDVDPPAPKRRQPGHRPEDDALDPGPLRAIACLRQVLGGTDLSRLA